MPSRGWAVAGRWGTLATRGQVCALPTPWRGTLGAASVSHAILVDGDQVLAAGQNGAGQLGTHATCDEQWHVATWQAPEPIRHVAAGMGFSLLGASHALYACGTNVHGQLGSGSTSKYSSSLVRLPWPRDAWIEGVAAGLDHALVLARDLSGAQRVWAWGLNTDGQLGDPTARSCTAQQRHITIPLTPQERLVRIAAGGDTSAALTDQGRLFVWGNTEYGQGLRPMDTADQQAVPMLATALPLHICDVQLGGSFVLLLDGRYPMLRGLGVHGCTVACSGRPSLSGQRANKLTIDKGRLYVAGYGATGHEDTKRTPVPLPLAQRVVRVHAGLHYAAAITEGGHLYTWGLDSPDGRLALGPPAQQPRVRRPQRVPAVAGAEAVLCGGASLLVRHSAA